MHALLSVVEVMFTEHMTAEELDEFNRRVYHDTPTVRADDPEPPGFSVAEQREGFAAFTAFAGGIG
ncbi:hypothetical protein [Nocardia sp. SC052]|uniref:hypothetical protein n=1 Tax=Nocardia sichangensis TaxID=3385975 RepID=UPI0039A1348E